MKAITFRTIILLTLLSAVGCKGLCADKEPTTTKAAKSATCGHCGKTSCSKSCTAGD